MIQWNGRQHVPVRYWQKPQYTSSSPRCGSTDADLSACLLTVCSTVKSHTNREHDLPFPYLWASHLKCLFCMYAGYFKGFRARYMPQQSTRLQESTRTGHLPHPNASHKGNEAYKPKNEHRTADGSRNKHGDSVLFLLPMWLRQGGHKILETQGTFRRSSREHAFAASGWSPTVNLPIIKSYHSLRADLIRIN